MCFFFFCFGWFPFTFQTEIQIADPQRSRGGYERPQSGLHDCIGSSLTSGQSSWTGMHEHTAQPLVGRHASAARIPHNYPRAGQFLSRRRATKEHHALGTR